nr:MAG TPA: hypothetical protein [Bacteriophage sp.]
MISTNIFYLQQIHCHGAEEHKNKPTTPVTVGVANFQSFFGLSLFRVLVAI